MAENISIFAAEVKEVIYQDKLPNAIYGIRIRDVSTPGSNENLDGIEMQVAIPLNYNFVRIPIVGEVVLALRAPGSYATGTRNSQTLYYLDVVSLQSSVHHNGLPTISAATLNPITSDSDKYENSSTGNTNKQQPPSIDPNFTEISTTKPLQHYVGDIIMEGRYGQSIRFSSTPKSGDFAVAPKFSGASGKPITIIRNTTQGTDTQRINDFVTETFTNEENVFVLASGQNLEFEQASKVLSSSKSKGITSWQDENWGTTPQALLSSGRIIFNSTQQEIIGFAKNGIAWSSETAITLDAKDNVSINAEKIELGTDADEPIILGNKFKSWAEGLIDDLGKLVVITPVGPSSPLSASPTWPLIAAYKSKIPTILSELAFTKKKSSASGGSGKFSSIPAPNFVLTEEQIQERVEEKEDVQEQLQNTELNVDERNALKDVNNRAEQEIKTGEAVSGEVPVAIEIEDIVDNAAATTEVVVNVGATKEEIEEIDAEVAQEEGEKGPDKNPDEEELPAQSEEAGELDNWVQDYEDDDEEEVDPDVEFEFEETEVDPSAYADTFSGGIYQSPGWIVPQEILDAGINVAKLANQDLTDLLKEEPIGSNGLGSPRIEAMMANVNIRPGLAPWHGAAVATWFKEAGLPIPDSGASTVQGWIEWGKSTKRYMGSPLVGCAAIIGTREDDPTDKSKPKIETATDIGVVLQVVDGTRAMICQLVKGELKLMELNIEQLLGFIAPSAKDLDTPLAPESTFSNVGELGNKPGFVINTGKDGRMHVVFQQGSKTGPWNKNGKPNAPWNPLRYGKQNQTTIAEGGCGICSIAAVVRNLTGDPLVDPYFFGLRYGGNAYGPPENPKQFAKDRDNYHSNNSGSSRSLIAKGASDYGLQYKDGPSEAEAIACMQRGGYLVAVGSGSKPFSKGGHYVHFYDYANGLFYCGNSVIGWNGIGYTWAHLKSQSNVRIWAIWNGGGAKVVNNAWFTNPHSEPPVDNAPVSAKDTIQRIAKKFKEMGITREGAIGFMGNVMAESGAKADIIEKKDQPIIGGYGGIGIVQWTADRRRDFEKRINNDKAKAYSLDEQIAYLEWELTNRSFKSSILPELKKTKSIEAATVLVLEKFEVPGSFIHRNDDAESKKHYEAHKKRRIEHSKSTIAYIDEVYNSNTGTA